MGIFKLLKLLHFANFEDSVLIFGNLAAKYDQNG
jgi:hypothetical protein